MNPSPMKCFIRVDVSDAANHRLIQQQRLQNPRSTSKQVPKEPRRKSATQRLHTERIQHVCRPRRNHNATKFPRIDKSQFVSILQINPKPLVLLPQRIGPSNRQPAGHAQVNQHRHVGPRAGLRQPKHDVFSTSRHLNKALANQ